MTPLMRRREFLAATVAATVAVAVRGGEPAAPLRVAVIGHTGRGNYGHGLDTMWRRLPETTVVAVADADAKGLDGALKKLEVTRGFRDYRQMLAETKPDIVAVAPRHVDQHRDMILAAVQAGVRGIYLEKPFCRTPAEADEIIAACESRHVRLAVAHRNRWHPVLPVLRQLISSGTLGRVLEIRARGKEDHRGGALDLWVLGSHLVNLATVFAGAPVSCTATLLQGGRLVTKTDVTEGAEGVGPLAGDEIHARFEMESGIPLFFDSIKGAGVPAAGFGIQIVGTQGVFDLRVDEEPVAHFLAGNPFQPAKESRRWVPVTTAGIGQPEPIPELGRLLAQHVIPGRDLIAAMQEGRETLCGAREAATTIEMICSVFESHRLNGQRVPLPLRSRVNPLSRL